jgi:hypothetical protein
MCRFQPKGGCVRRDPENRREGENLMLLSAAARAAAGKGGCVRRHPENRREGENLTLHRAAARAAAGTRFRSLYLQGLITCYCWGQCPARIVMVIKSRECSPYPLLPIAKHFVGRSMHVPL